MPELPEVETIVRDLRKHVTNRTIKSVDVKVKKLFRGEQDAIIDSTITEVVRKGKIILIRFNTGLTLAIHLKMTGQLIFLERKIRNHKKQETNSNKFGAWDLESDISTRGVVGGHPDKAYASLPPHKYTHISIEFSDGSHLYFNDLRKFGWLDVGRTDQEERLVKHLGPDPLIGIEIGYLTEKYKRRGKSPIKNVLLDQGIISGVGNIYADETLFCAKVKPTRKTGSLTRKEIQKIAECMPLVLNKSIEAGGTSKSDYVKLDGSKGGYLDIAWVYGREGLPCRVCGRAIKRIKIGQRSSHFCPHCQK